MANIKVSTNSQVNHCAMMLTLNHGENNETKLFKIKKGARLLFCPGPSLLGKKIALFCNYASEGNDFNRTKYNLLQWNCGRTSTPILPETGTFTTIKDTDMYCEILPQLPGSYHYFFTYDSQSPMQYQGSGYFSKDPVIEIGCDSDKILLQPDAVRCQTVLVKCLGPLKTWESKLRVAKESGYNMIHFTPIQELGESRSSYSINDQLKLNSAISGDENVDFEDVGRFMKKISDDWKIASICDVVLNHTANESEWLKKQPNCAYNCLNSPHLRPAALLDFAFVQLSKTIAAGTFKSSGIPNNISSEVELEALRTFLTEIYLPKLKIWEFYQVNVEHLTQEFSNLIGGTTLRCNNYYNREEVVILQDAEYKRFGSTVDLIKAVDVFYIKGQESNDEEMHRKYCCGEFSKRLAELNNEVFLLIQIHLTSAIDNALAGIRYERIQEDGPKYQEINEKHPLFTSYFTNCDHQEISLEEIEKDIFSESGCFIMAHNGWVMNSDPLNDFAKFQGGIGNVYLRRELIAWGDSVKLRYGDGPEDCPYLWNHMRKYVEQTVKIFHGVRLDNCHSTPLHVAEYLLDCARKIRPHLYVVAELFTNSDSKDNIFLNRLGITTLIREAQSAWDSHELGRLVYRYGGKPVGAFQENTTDQNQSINKIEIQKLVPSIANALFMDLTHDNPSPIEKRSVYDLLPTSALVSMACCGTGSNRGYDELVPHHIHVVEEEREYAAWDDLENHYGIILAKKCLNNLHDMMSSQGFSEVYVDQMNENIVAVTRHNPRTHDSIILVAYTSFKSPISDWPISSPYIKPLCFEGQFQEILFEVELFEK